MIGCICSGIYHWTCSKKQSQSGCIRPPYYTFCENSTYINFEENGASIIVVKIMAVLGRTGATHTSSQLGIEAKVPAYRITNIVKLVRIGFIVSIELDYCSMINVNSLGWIWHWSRRRFADRILVFFLTVRKKQDHSQQ